MKKIIIFFTLIVPNRILSQEKVFQQETATITATNSNQKNSETGRNIIIVKGSLFEKLAINSIDELLKYAAGVEVQQRGPQGSQSDILIRGGTFQQVLILLDGVRLNDPLTGHFNGNIPIHPNEIDRIEILKGPASAVWGSDAVGGVIHIITKAFLSNKIEEGKKMNLGFQLGQFGLANFNMNASKKTKDSYYSVGIFSNNAEGEELRGTTGYFNTHTLHGSMSKSLQNGWKLNTKLIADFRKFNAQNFYTTFISDTANETVNTFFSHIQLKKTWNHQTLTTDLSYKGLSDEFQFNNLGSPNKNRTKQFLYQLNYQSRIDDDNELISGIQIMRRSIRSNDRGNHQLWNGGAWFILKHQMNNKVFINEGVRLDWHPNYGMVATPQINFAYNPSKWTFRASYARGIRDADFTERYNNYNRALVRNGSIGNPDLKTEKTWNMEIGADYIPDAQLKLSFTGFYRNQNNLIDWTPTPYSQMPRKINLVPTGNYALALNLENVNTYGVEMDINLIKKINENQSLIFNYNFTQLKSENDDSIPSFYISGHANFINQFNILYSVKAFSIALNGLYKYRNANKASAINATISRDYFLINTKLAYGFYNNRISAFAQVYNIFDKNYSDILGAIMPGRWMSAGLNIAL